MKVREGETEKRYGRGSALKEKKKKKKKPERKVLLNAVKLQITSSKVRNNTPAGPSSARIITTIANYFLSRINSII